MHCGSGCRDGPNGAKWRRKSSTDRLVWNLRWGLVLPSKTPALRPRLMLFPTSEFRLSHDLPFASCGKLPAFEEQPKIWSKASATKPSHEFNKSAQPLHLSPEGRATAFPADAAGFRFGDGPDRPQVPAYLLGRSTQGGHPIWHEPRCDREPSELLGWSPLPLLPLECRGSGHVPRIRQRPQSVR